MLGAIFFCIILTSIWWFIYFHWGTRMSNVLNGAALSWKILCQINHQWQYKYLRSARQAFNDKDVQLPELQSLAFSLSSNLLTLWTFRNLITWVVIPELVVPLSITYCQTTNEAGKQTSITAISIINEWCIYFILKKFTVYWRNPMTGPVWC